MPNTNPVAGYAAKVRLQVIYEKCGLVPVTYASGIRKSTFPTADPKQCSLLEDGFEAICKSLRPFLNADKLHYVLELQGCIHYEDFILLCTE